MTEERKKQGGLGALVFTIAAVLLVPLLYVLSIGPAVAIMPLSTVNFIYHPLAVLAQYVAPFKLFINWYLDLWN